MADLTSDPYLISTSGTLVDLSYPRLAQVMLGSTENATSFVFCEGSDVIYSTALPLQRFCSDSLFYRDGERTAKARQQLGVGSRSYTKTTLDAT